MSTIRGRRVVDVSTDIAGQYAGRLLARNGWDVTRATIDDDRARPSMIFDGTTSAAGSAYRRYLSAGTARVSVGLDALGDLLRDADVVLSTFPRDAAAALGLLPDSLRSSHPQATLVSLTPFGLDADDVDGVATEGTLFARSGMMFVSGSPDDVPLCPRLPIASILGGIYGAAAAMLDAVADRPAGRTVDLSLLEVLVANTERVLSWYSYLEAVPQRGAGSGRLEQASGGGFLRAVDGWFYVFSGYQWFDKVAELVGRPELVQDGADPAARRARSAEADRIVSEAIAGLSVGELSRRVHDLRMPSGPVNTPLSLLDDPQLAARGTFSVRADGAVDIDEAYRFHTAPSSPPPPSGTVNRPEVDADELPLTGMRVLDLSHAFAGPTSSRMLAEAGADVLKIESVGRLDLLARGMLPFDNDTSGAWWDRSAYYGERNLGKRSLALDMASERGREIFLRLLDGADVVVANFTPRVLNGWGLGPGAMLEANPRLVVLMMTGFGMHGPKADDPALAGTMEAASGFSSLVRHDDDQAPGALGINFGDMVAGVTGCMAVLAALARRQQTGLGEVIDFACAEAPLPFLAAHITEAHATGADPSAATDLYHAGRHVLIEAGDKPTGQRWILAYLPAGSPDLSPEVSHRLQLEGRGPALRSALERDEILSVLNGSGILAAAVADAEDLWFDQGLRARQLYALATRPGVPTLPYARSLPGRWDDRPLAPAPRRIPSLGDANHAVLVGELGLPEEELEALIAAGVTGSEPMGRLPKTFQVPLALDELEDRGLIRRVDGARDRLLSSFPPT